MSPPHLGPALHFIAIQVSYMCPYLFYYLLLSLMTNFILCDRGFLCVPHATPGPARHGRAPVPSPTCILLPLPYFFSVSTLYSPYSLWIWLQTSSSQTLPHAAQLCQPSAPRSLLCHSLCDPGYPSSLSLGPFISNPNLPSLSYTLLQLPHSLLVKLFSFLQVQDAGTVPGQFVMWSALMWARSFKKGKKNVYSTHSIRKAETLIFLWIRLSQGSDLYLYWQGCSYWC